MTNALGGGVIADLAGSALRNYMSTKF